jgi:hypothetical protein
VGSGDRFDGRTGDRVDNVVGGDHVALRIRWSSSGHGAWMIISARLFPPCPPEAYIHCRALLAVIYSYISEIRHRRG